MLHARPSRDERFFAISPLLIFPQAMGSFSIFIRKDNTYILYAKAGEQFSDHHRKTLFENGVREVYVRLDQRSQYGRYVEQNLGSILNDETLPIAERAGAFYRASTEMMREAFLKRMPTPLESNAHQRMLHLVTQSIRFLSTEDSLKALGSLMTHDFSAYNHSINVFVYTTLLLHRIGLSEAALIQAGIGCLTHDIGLARIPKEYTRRLGNLSLEEQAIYDTHPTLGVAMSTQVPLTQDAINCILLHHEYMDGSGTPSGIGGEQIPPLVRALTIADTFDTLTTRRHGAPLTAFGALDRMRTEYATRIDLDVFREFVILLSGSGFGDLGDEK